MPPEILQILLGRLLKMRDEGPTCRSVGICSNALVGDPDSEDGEDPLWREIVTWLRATGVLWPEFSGSMVFPVPHVALPPNRAYDLSYRNLWDQKSPYGQARYRLLDFMIERALLQLSTKEAQP